MQNVSDRLGGAAEGWFRHCCVCLFLFPQPPDPCLILSVHLKWDVCYLAPHPHLCYYGHRSSELWVAGRPSPLFSTEPSPSNIIPLCPRSLSFEKGSWFFKKWTWAIQGVSKASRSARLLNAKQTVEQIKIKGSSLACLACCPHIPSAAVTVNHCHAASVLTLALLPRHLRATDPLGTVTVTLCI